MVGQQSDQPDHGYGGMGITGYWWKTYSHTFYLSWSAMCCPGIENFNFALLVQVLSPTLRHPDTAIFGTGSYPPG